MTIPTTTHFLGDHRQSHGFEFRQYFLDYCKSLQLFSYLLSGSSMVQSPHGSKTHLFLTLKSEQVTASLNSKAFHHRVKSELFTMDHNTYFPLFTLAKLRWPSRGSKDSPSMFLPQHLGPSCSFCPLCSSLRYAHNSFLHFIHLLLPKVSSSNSVPCHRT